MPASFARAAVLLLALAGLAGAQDGDPVKVKLDAAKADYQAKMNKLNTGVTDALTKREDDARKAGQAKLLDATKAEREAFDVKGVVPKWLNPDGYVKTSR